MVNEEKEFDRKQQLLDLEIASIMLKVYSWSKDQKHLASAREYQRKATDLSLKLVTHSYPQKL